MAGVHQISRYQQTLLRTYTQLMRAMDAVTANMHRHLSGFNLTISQFGVLEALYHLGPLCQKEIGTKILKTSGNMTTVIDNLEKRGLVVRERRSNDRRFFTVRLTPEGHDLIDTIFPRHARVAQDVFSVLDEEEIRILGTLLKKLGKENALNKQTFQVEQS
ncbi:MAG: MarR family transcriptional regulator [Pseudomonadota bacterium]